MNTFSIAVSKRLREIGVEGETDMFWLYGNNGEELCSIDRIENSDEHWIHLVDKIPAYTLHDIFRLMPKIGEILSFNEIEKTCEIADVFLWGDYPEAEKVLLDLLKEHE